MIAPEQPDAKRIVEILEARTHLLDFAIDHTLDDLLEETLNMLEKLTGSQIAFYHFVQPDQKTLALQNWSTRTKTFFCKAEGAGMHYDIDQAGVWVDCFHQKKPVIYNDFPSLTHKRGLPPGHAEVTRIVSVPVIRDDKVVAILGVGNKPTDYDDSEAKLVSTFADLAWDIAERKRTLLELQTAKEHYSEFAEASLDGVSYWRTPAGLKTDLRVEKQVEMINQSVCLDANRATWESYGLSTKDELVGKKYSEIAPGRTLDRSMTEFVKNNYRLDNFENLEEQLPDGTRLYSLLDWYGVVENNCLTHIWAAAKDISDLKLTQERLRHEREISKQMIESAPTFFIAFDAHGKTLVMNNSMLEATGYSRDEVIGQDYISMFVPEQEQETLDALFEEMSSERTRKFHENHVVAKNGREMLVSWHGCSLGDTDESAWSFFGIGIDITERMQAEERLIASEKKFSKVFFSTPDSITLTAVATGQIIEANHGFERIFGFTREEAIGKTTVDLGIWKSAEDRARMARVLEEDDRVRSMELQLYTKKGESIPCLLSGELIDIQGVKCLLAVLRDITEQIQAAETLRLSEEKFATTFKHSPNPLMLIDVGSRTALDVNEAYTRIFGYHPEEIVGIPGKVGFAVTNRKELEPFWKTAEAGEIVEGMPMKITTKNGEHVELNVYAQPVELRDRSLFIINMIDITERRRAEEARRESEQRFTDVVRHATVGIFQTTSDGRILSANDGLGRMLGYASGEEFAGAIHDLANQLYVDPKRREDWIRAIKIDGTVKGFEFEARRKDGSSAWLSLSIRIRREYPDGTFAVDGFATDVTERRQAEQELQRSEEKYRAMIENTGTATCLMTEDSTITYANKSFQELTGYSRAEIEGKMRTLDFMSEKSKGFVGEIREKRMNGEPIPSMYDLEMETRDKSIRNTVAKLHQIPHSESFVVSLLDITDRVQREEQLKLANLEIQSLKERLEAENVYLRKEVQLAHTHGDIIGSSDAMKSVLAQAEQVAPSDSTVLILGDTGTGKELIAREIHKLSSRKDRSLVVVNCAAMPTALVESELFGREKGAYTGALTKQIGRFEAANQGTIFLDEVGELPGETQAKLLRVLQEGQLERLGSSKTISVDVRVVAATNRDLEKLVEQDRFRSDLFYRLNVFPIVIPPLRDRPDDIEPLVMAFVGEFASRMGKRIESVSQASLDTLKKYSWPGNVRELRNLIERAMIGSSGTKLNIPAPRPAAGPSPEKRSLAEMERSHILSVLGEVGWRVRGRGGAAEVLEINPTTLESRMKKLGIQRPA